MSLASRLIATIALVLVATLWAGSLLTYWHALGRVETETGAALAQGIRTVRETMEDAARLPEPRRELVRLVHTFNESRHLHAILLDENGVGMAFSSIIKPERDVPEWFLSLLRQPPKSANIPVPQGILHLETDARGEIGEIWEDVQRNLMITALFFSLALGLVYWTLQRALSPLPALISGFEQIGGGDYRACVVADGPPELQQLCSGFNQMAARLNSMEAETRSLNEQLQRVQEEERAEVARDLHDEIGPLLFSVEVDAMALEELAPEISDSRLTEKAQAIRDAAAEMKSHVRELLATLRPATVMDRGLKHGIEQLVSAASSRRTGLVVTADVADRSWGAKLDETLFHLVRESLANALRHAGASRIEIRIGEDGQGGVCLSIRDNGNGLPAETAPLRFGIVGMRERASLAGGSLTIANRSGSPGVEVRARFPVLKAEAAISKALVA